MKYQGKKSMVVHCMSPSPAHFSNRSVGPASSTSASPDFQVRFYMTHSEMLIYMHVTLERVWNLDFLTSSDMLMQSVQRSFRVRSQLTQGGSCNFLTWRSALKGSPRTVSSGTCLHSAVSVKQHWNKERWKPFIQREGYIPLTLRTPSSS